MPLKSLTLPLHADVYRFKATEGRVAMNSTAECDGMERLLDFPTSLKSGKKKFFFTKNMNNFYNWKKKVTMQLGKRTNPIPGSTWSLYLHKRYMDSAL